MHFAAVSLARQAALNGRAHHPSGVRIDTVPPEVALTGPTDDLLTVDQGVATCTVPLGPGRNAVVLVARDFAGRADVRCA